MASVNANPAAWDHARKLVEAAGSITSAVGLLRFLAEYCESEAVHYGPDAEALDSGDFSFWADLCEAGEYD